jgi:hypothetical protein
MLDYADKFLKIAVGLGVLAAGAGVGYHYGFRDQKSEQTDQTEIKPLSEQTDQTEIKPLDDKSIIEISNIYKGIDSSGASIFLKKSSESDYSGTILICEGGCDKFPANATLRKNILTLQYRTNWEQNGKINYESHSEKLDLSELWDDGRVHAEDNGKSPEGLLYDCRIAKKGVDGDRMVASTYCYNHEDY